MIHNSRDHGYGWDQNHGITRNYDLKIQDHDFPRIKTTWPQNLLRSKSWDHGFFDHGSQKLQFVRSCDYDLFYIFWIKKKKIIEIKFPKSMDHEFSWSQIEYLFGENETHFVSVSCCTSLEICTGVRCCLITF